MQILFLTGLTIFSLFVVCCLLVQLFACSIVCSLLTFLILNSTEPNSAVDLLFVVKYVTAPLGDCIQIGGSVEKCTNLYAWPAEWNTDAVNGQLYTATIDVSGANYNWPEGQYQVSTTATTSHLIVL